MKATGQTKAPQKHIYAVIACVLCENPSALQTIILSSKVGTECNSRLPVCCVGLINYIIFYISMFFHILHLKVKLISDRNPRTTGR